MTDDKPTIREEALREAYVKRFEAYRLIISDDDPFDKWETFWDESTDILRKELIHDWNGVSSVLTLAAHNGVRFARVVSALMCLGFEILEDEDGEDN